MAFGKGWNDGWWRDAWRYDWGKGNLKGRGRKGDAKGDTKGDARDAWDAKGDGRDGRDGRDGKGVKERTERVTTVTTVATPETEPTVTAATVAPPAPPPPRAPKEETSAPRAKDEVFEEIRNVLNANPALQIQFFDARVRQHLHALLGNGGRQRLKAALTMVHTCTMHKTRQDVKNWPAYLLTLLKKFDADVAHQDPSERRVAAAKIVEAKTDGQVDDLGVASATALSALSQLSALSSASTTPEKTEQFFAKSATSSEDGVFAEFELPSLGLEGLDESDEEPEPPLELKAPRVTAPPPKPRQNDMGFDLGFQAHPAHPGHHSRLRDLDMQGHQHARFRDAEMQERRALDFQASANISLLNDDDMQGYLRRDPEMQAHPAHPGHHSRLRDLDMQERRALDFQVRPDGRPYSDAWPCVPRAHAAHGAHGAHGVGVANHVNHLSGHLGPVTVAHHEDVGTGNDGTTYGTPHGTRLANHGNHATHHVTHHGSSHVHGVTYGGQRSNHDAARLVQPGVRGTPNFPAQRSEVVAR